MELHHFTAKIYLPAIVADGLRYGDTPTSFSEGINAVNLTSDHRPHGQKWTARSTINKSEIRLTIEITNDDPLLIKWSHFAKSHVDPAFYKDLNGSGGGHADCWYLYRGVIPWAWVRRVHNTVTHEDLMLDSELLIFSKEMTRYSREFSQSARRELENFKNSSGSK